MHTIPHSALLLTTFIQFTVAQYQKFVTRPNDIVVAINILENPSPSALSPGYFFLTPLINNGPAFGPQIFDSNGQLVYNGHSAVRNRANGATVCNYNGQPSLCFNDGISEEQSGHSSGVNRFLSTSYVDIDTAHTYGAMNGLRGPDNHEENTPDGHYVLQTVFQPRQVDLTSFGGNSGGWILDGCFQDVSIPDAQLQFQWCAYGNIALNESFIHMKQTGLQTNPVGGSGVRSAPWDPYHINSIARDALTLDYVVSLRHCNVLLRICGPGSTSTDCAGKSPGDIAWRLGGKRSDFDLDFNFSGQHMVRWHNGYLGNTANSTLSIFNDASDGVTSTANHSSGLIFTADFSTRTAALLARYELPEEYTMLSVSQGSFQLLPDGNTLIGWGSQPYYSELSPSGALLYHARFGAGAASMQNYRAFKYPWVGTPVTQPDLVAYAGNCTRTVYGYASWNGATEVQGWRFRGSNSSSVSGRWRVLANVKRRGFETETFLSGGVTEARYVQVEALNSAGTVIGVSAVVKTFVPSEDMIVAHECSAMGCQGGTDYGALASGNVADTC